MSALTIPSRYCGPPSSGNGGWIAGALAALLAGPSAEARAGWPAIRVSLRLPPPLETELSVREAEPDVQALHDDRVVAQAELANSGLVEVPAVDLATARAAEASYAGLVRHPFATCFSCGPAREPGDGLRIFPGEVAPGRVAASWTPDPRVLDPELAAEQAGWLPVTWAAVDCVGGWSCDLIGRPMVLGQITARVDALPAPGEPHVLVGEHRGDEGRKTFTASTLYDRRGQVVACAQHVWITVDPGTFGPSPR